MLPDQRAQAEETDTDADQGEEHRPEIEVVADEPREAKRRCKPGNAGGEADPCQGGIFGPPCPDEADGSEHKNEEAGAQRPKHSHGFIPVKEDGTDRMAHAAEYQDTTEKAIDDFQAASQV